MKDLYKRLNIPLRATAAQIEFALQHCEKERIVEDAEYILLDPTRRAVYDRNHKMLQLIASLRHRLSLEQTPFWSYDEYRDYIDDGPAQTSTLTRTDSVRPTSSRPATARTTPVSPASSLSFAWLENDRTRFFVVFGVLLVLYALLYIGFY